MKKDKNLETPEDFEQAMDFIDARARKHFFIALILVVAIRITLGILQIL